MKRYQKLWALKWKILSLGAIAGIGTLCMSLTSCEQDLVNEEEYEIPFPPPVPVSPESDFEYSSEGAFTLAVFKPLAQSEAIAKIKSDLALFQADMLADDLEKWGQDTVWVEFATEAITYYPLSENVARSGSIVIGDEAGFLEAAEKKPALFIRYLAEAYYDKYMGNAEQTAVIARYEEVKTDKYEKVYMSNGTKLVMDQVAPASQSAMKYFAETSAAYFDENDYYPFDHEELQRYDEPMFEMLEAIWGARTLAPNQHGITLPPTSLRQWLAGEESELDLYYRKYIDAGLPVLSSRFVSDEAIIQAKYIIEVMLKDAPESLDEMLKANFRVGIIGAYENVTDMPENRFMNIWWPGTDWDARGRGYGATEHLPLMTCGEENIIQIPDYTERYPHESIMVHEFAHNVDFGLRKGRPGFEAELIAAYQDAKESGLWEGTYSMENDAEYFAVGAQTWFDTGNMYVMIDGVSTHMKTRELLRDYDPTLYNLLATVFPEDKLTGYHFTYE